MDVVMVQRRLYEQSKEHKEHKESSLPLFPVDPYEKRIYNLMDLMHQPDWIWEATRRVLSRSRNKASGIDGVTVSQFNWSLENNVEELRRELKTGTYQPKPVRQVMIPKSNGKMRALGIPCLRDKIVQEAIRMALEPIFEVEFHENSYGFRPHRNAHHAVFRCQQLMRTKFTWVIEGDVKACFDEISHAAILKAVREKVMDNKFLELITRFLKAGVSVKGVVQPTEKGVPQGGVISPLLANAVLNKLDWFIHNKGGYGMNMQYRSSNGLPNVRFTRYADDWCVFVTRANKEYVEHLKEEIRIFLLDECGLRLSPEKTKITHVTDGYDFLGFHLIQQIGQGTRTIPKIKIGQKALTNLHKRLDDAMRWRPQQESLATRVLRGNAVLRGWAEYYRIAHDFTAKAGTFDHWAFWTMVKAISRKLDLSTGKVCAKYYRNGVIQIDDSCRLEPISGMSMKMDYSAPERYNPGISVNDSDDELEADFKRFNETGRQGNEDARRAAMSRDNYTCQICGTKLTPETANVDHIVPIRKFKSFEAATTMDNLQTLCRKCHVEKHKNAK